MPASFWAPYAATLIIGLLIGVLLTVIVYGVVRGAPQRRARRAERERERRMKQWAKTPLPQLWNPGPARTAEGTQSRHARTGSINYYLDGPRDRPDFNPAPGPRDW